MTAQGDTAVAAAVAAAPDASSALRAALETIAVSGGWPVARALVADPDGRLRSAAWHVAEPRYQPFQQVSEALDASSGLPGQAWTSVSAMWVEDLSAEPAFLRRQAAAMCGLVAAALLPLQAGTERLGLIELFSLDAEVVRRPAFRGETEALVSAAASALLERRRADAQSEGQARFHALFDGPMGMAVLSSSLAVVEANAALAALVGAAPSELTGRSFPSLLDGQLDEWAEQLRATGNAYAEVAHLAVRGWAAADGFAVLVDPQSERRRVEEAFNTRAARRGVAMELVRSITVEADLLRAVAESARGLVNAHLAGVALNGVDGSPFEVFVPAGVPDAEAARIGRRPVAAGVLSALVLENRPLRIADVAAHPASAGLPAGHPAISTFLGLPLVAGGQTIGHLFVANRFDGQPFDQADESFLDDFAGAAAAAIAHVRTMALARTATTRLRQLVQANLNLIQQARRDKLPRSAVELLRTVTDAEYAALLITDGAGAVTTFLHAGLTPTAAGRIGALPQARGLLHAAMAAQRPMRLTDLRHHPTHGGFPAHHPVMRSFLSAPVMVSGQPRGLLFCTNKRSLADFTAEDEESAVRIAAAVAHAVDSRHDEGDSLLRNLAAASERLRDEEARHWRFLGSLSHELRSAIGGILMSADLIADPAFGGLSEEKTRGVGTRIGTTARSLMELVDNLLDLSRIQAGRLEVRMQPVEVQPIINEVVAQLGPLAVDADVALDVAPLPGSTPRILADPVRFRQVLVNLVSNAVKFTPPHGHVVVEVQVLNEHDVAVAVSDTGVGIDPADLARLFEPFERARDARAPGTGLGLPISAAIMELHGGRLEAESWPGVGSRFVATFRVARLPHYTAEVERAVADSGPLMTGRGTVLLVEDNEASRESTVSVLSAAGYRVVAVSSRAAALAAMPAVGADLVLLDVHLPDGDGLEIVPELRALGGGAGSLRVVAFSADRIGNTEERARAVCDDFVLKPLRPRELLRRVGLLTGRRS